MKIVEREHCHLFDAINNPFIAGFTKPSLGGDPVVDTAKALSFATPQPDIAYLKQVHSARIHFVHKPGLYEGDGLFTQEARIALVVKTADCLPLLLYSRALGVLGVVHMGWRGAREGILDGIAGAIGRPDLAGFTAVAGVGMRSCCYEVGEDFAQCAQLRDFLSTRAKRLLFDPVAFARSTLAKYGIKEENFFDLGICSLCAPQKYFSYRRDKTSARTLSFIVKTQ